MKDLLIWVAIVIGFVLFIGVCISGYRQFSSATVAEVVFEPVPGVQCVKLVTGDGAAVDCWRTK